MNNDAEIIPALERVLTSGVTFPNVRVEYSIYSLGVLPLPCWQGQSVGVPEFVKIDLEGNKSKQSSQV